MARAVRGFSLVEVIVSAGILFLVMNLLLNLLSTSIRGTAVAEKRLTAESLAESALEQFRARAYANLEPDHSENRTDRLDDTVYRTVIQVSTVPGYAPDNLKSIKAYVSWDGVKGKESIELTGYVTPLLR